jgi:hypothetical protein
LPLLVVDGLTSIVSRMCFNTTRRVAAAVTDLRHGAVVRSSHRDGPVPRKVLVVIVAAPKAIDPIFRDGTSQSSHRQRDMPCHVRA